MREVIAKRSNKWFVFMLVVGSIGLLNGIFWRVESMKWVGILCIVVNVFVLACSLLMFFANPRNTIEKCGDRLFINIWMGIGKRPQIVVDIKDVTDVSFSPVPDKPGKFNEKCLTITAFVDGKQGEIHTFELVDAPGALAKLKALIGKE
ncbi:MAG: hypothetical protein IJY13_03090 [Clostridia bacterium]|nr:hypothetical protein [Clostridia bacterium]